MTHGKRTLGSAIHTALGDREMSQAKLAELLGVEPSQVSRWTNDRQNPKPRTVQKMEEILGPLTPLTGESIHDIYVAAPMRGLDKSSVQLHQEQVGVVVGAVRLQVSDVFWSGANVDKPDDWDAPDLVTEHNMRALLRARSLLYLQFSPLERPTMAMVELGVAIGRRLPAAIILGKDVPTPYGFEGIVAALGEIPDYGRCRMYRLATVQAAVRLLSRSIRQILDLPQGSPQSSRL